MKKEEIQKETTEENSKKNNKLLSVLLGVVLILVGFGIGYVVGSYLFEESDEGKTEEKEEETNKEENDGKEEVELETLDVNSAVVKKLFEVFREDEPEGFEYAKKDVNTDVESKMFIAYQQLDNTKFAKVSCDGFEQFWDEDDQSGYWCGEFNSEKQAIDNSQTLSFKASLLEDKYKEIFGLKAKYSNSNFTVGPLDLAYYDKESDSYVFYIVVGGVEKEYEYTQTLESINQSGKQLVLNTKMVKDCIVEDDPSLDSVFNISYTFEYEKETGNYIFVSREEK